MTNRQILYYIVRIIIILVQISNLENARKLMGVKRLEEIKEEVK